MVGWCSLALSLSTALAARSGNCAFGRVEVVDRLEEGGEVSSSKSEHVSVVGENSL